MRRREKVNLYTRIERDGKRLYAVPDLKKQLTAIIGDKPERHNEGVLKRHKCEFEPDLAERGLTPEALGGLDPMTEPRNAYHGFDLTPLIGCSRC